MEWLKWYYTAKVVGIESKTLGYLYYITVMMIFMYTVIYTILYRKGYLENDNAVGSILMGVAWPNDSEIESNGGYCGHGMECRIWDVNELLKDTLCGYRDILITTKVEEIYEERVCGMNASKCPSDNIWRERMDRKSYYVAGIDQLELKIFHTVLAPHFYEEYQESRYMMDSKDMGGILLRGHDSGRIVYQNFQKGDAPDTIKLKTLLQAADINEEDIKTILNNGIILHVDLGYNNAHCDMSLSCLLGTSPIRYRYRIHKVSNTYSSNSIIHQDFKNGLRTRRVEYGIHISVYQTGKISRFSMLVLMLNIVGGMGMVTICTVIVDILAVYFLPKRNFYTNLKYELQTKEKPE